METSTNRKAKFRLKCSGCGTLIDPEQTEWMPFCSLRCKEIDLGRWFNEEIGLPIDPELDEEI